LAMFIAGTSGVLLLNLRHELDHDLVDNVENIEQVLSFGPDGKLKLEQADAHPDPDRPQRLYVEIRELNGAILYRNAKLGGASLGGMPFTGEGKDGYSPRSSILPDGTRIRLASRLHSVGSHPVVIRVATSEEPLWHDFRESVWALLAAFPMALAVAGFVAF